MWTLLSTPLVSHDCQRYYSYNYRAASHILLYNNTDNAVGIDLRSAARIRGYVRLLSQQKACEYEIDFNCISARLQ